MTNNYPFNDYSSCVAWIESQKRFNKKKHKTTENLEIKKAFTIRTNDREIVQYQSYVSYSYPYRDCCSLIL